MSEYEPSFELHIDPAAPNGSAVTILLDGEDITKKVVRVQLDVSAPSTLPRVTLDLLPGAVTLITSTAQVTIQAEPCD